jgi:hypothetical protein
MGSRRRKHIPAVERVADVRQYQSRIRDGNDLTYGFHLFYSSEDAIIRSYEEMVLRPGDDRLSGAAYPRINYRHMDRPTREVAKALLQDEGRPQNTLRGYIVGKIHDTGFGTYGQNYTLHNTDKGVVVPKVRS